jgi:tetratricopeptide (TPR) repeat protein
MPRRSIFFLTALLVVCCFVQLDHAGSSNAQGQTREQSPLKSVITEKIPTKTEKTADYSQEAIVLEQLKMFYRFEKDGTGQRELSVRVRVQSEAGLQRFGQLVFAYSSANENFDVDFLRVRKADGSVINAGAGDIQDLSAPIAREAPVYTDLRQKHVTVRGLRPGDVLEYHVVWRLHTPLAQNNFWLEQDFSNPESVIILDEQLEVNIPLDSKVKLKTAPGIDPNVREQDERRIYTWKYTNLKREDKDEKAESAKKKEEEGEPKPPQIQMTTFQSWDQVGQWYAGLERDRIVPDDKIRAKTEELLRGRNSDKDKIEALYEYVAKNFRYVSLSLGQGRYQPHAAADVYANQYGDCKDKHTLLSSMLIAAGLRGYPALMNSSRKLDVDVPSPGQFDHVITAIPLAGETLWMDSTSEVAPFRLIAPQLRDKKALLVPASGPARLENTPAEPPFLSTEFLDMEGQVNELGKLSGHTHLAVRGDSELLFRLIFRRTPKSDWKNLRYYLSMVSGIRDQEVSEIKPSEPAAFEKPFEVDYDFASDDFLDWSSRKVKLAIPLPSLRLTEVAADKQDDSKPIPLGPPIDITYRLKLSLPSQYQTRLPLPLTVKRDYAEYSSTYKLEGNSLVAERKFHLRQHELPAARVQDYRAFVAAARADEAQTMSMETSVAGTPSIPETVKVEELIQAAQAAAKNENYPLVEQLLKRVLEKEPKHKEVRRQLAWALFAQRKFEPAITALREQTAINPFDDYSYNLLGRVFWQQQNYAEAETAFRKQIEITPLDQSSHSNLGQMLVDWRKYKEAVPELEQAISLNPEEEFLYVSLGRAYLNLGETTKGTEAFDKAVKLAPGQRVWNDVAYFLAVGKVQLDKAQQYAESAVTAVATDLRNVELEGLTLENLAQVSSLAADWDTLGWVHFQKGNIDLAERYINAAWALEQHSDVGYHLGQIYEKRGKKEEAIHMYALATASDRLVPEAQESLIRLAGKDKSETLWKQADAELRDSRTIKLGAPTASVKGATEAQFYVVLTPGPSRSAQVTAVKFIRGDEKLGHLATVLKGGNFNFVFPDDTTTKVIRRGTLFCQATGTQCSFLMLSPEFISSVD